MARIVLHLGTHKTGTSAIQSFLFQNRQALKERGVLYRPFSKISDNHHQLAVRFRDDAVDRDRAVAFIHQLIEEAGDDGTVLISSEMLSESPTDVDAFAECFSGHPVTTVWYVRHPCDLILSVYNQKVKSPKARYCRSLSLDNLPYDPSLTKRLQRWTGVGRMVLCPYDKNQWHDGNLIKDFLRTIGVDGAGLVGFSVRKNEAIGYPGLEAIRSLTAAGIDDASRAAIIDVLQSATFAPNEYPLSQEFCHELQNMMRIGIERFHPYLREGFSKDFLFEKRPK